MPLVGTDIYRFFDLVVQEGASDVAAVDCVVLELARRHRPERLQGLRAIAATASIRTAATRKG